MSTTELTPTDSVAEKASAPTASRGGGQQTHDVPGFRPIPFSRLLSVELVKMFNTRSGVWLLRSIVITAVLAAVAVSLWAPDQLLTYDTFGAAITIPMTVILPIIAMLSVTSEWTQRTGLATFTMVPQRGRVIAAKFVVTLGVGLAGVVVAFSIGAIGHLLGAAANGVDPTWDLTAERLAFIGFASMLNMLIGFMLGVLIRNSAGAIVAYFVYQFVLSGLTEILAATQQWFADIRGWVDFNFSQGTLFEQVPDGEHWAQLGTSGLIWLIVPLAVGIALVMRSEVK